jgi:hypothetical protein
VPERKPLRERSSTAGSPFAATTGLDFAGFFFPLLKPTVKISMESIATSLHEPAENQPRLSDCHGMQGWQFIDAYASEAVIF